MPPDAGGAPSTPPFHLYRGVDLSCSDFHRPRKVIEGTFHSSPERTRKQFPAVQSGFSILDFEVRKYYKIWEMACFSGFLMGREAAPLGRLPCHMPEHGVGSIGPKCPRVAEAERGPSRKRREEARPFGPGPGRVQQPGLRSGPALAGLARPGGREQGEGRSSGRKLGGALTSQALLTDSLCVGAA